MSGEHQQPHDNTDVDASAQTEVEAAQRERPRIYVASLSDYNDGRLHGAWINADMIVDDIRQEIANMLEASPMIGAEEWAVHDYDGFGPVRLGEFESIDTVARIGEGIRDYGEAFAHWASIAGTDEDTLEQFEDAYQGCWETDTAYAESLLEAYGVQEALDHPDFPLSAYVRIDVDMFVRDLSADHYFSQGAEGVHVFQA